MATNNIAGWDKSPPKFQGEYKFLALIEKVEGDIENKRND